MIKDRLPKIIAELMIIDDNFKLELSREVIFQEACGFLRGELANEDYINREKMKKPWLYQDENQSPTSSKGSVLQNEVLINPRMRNDEHSPLGDNQSKPSSTQKEEGLPPAQPSSNGPKLASAKQLAYAQRMAKELGVQIYVSEKTTSKEISGIINDLERQY